MTTIGRLAVDRVVTGQQTDGVLAVAIDEVAVLLVGQRLDRRGVEALTSALQRQVNGELADHGLAGPGGCGDQHRLAAGERFAGLHLEGVQAEGVALTEPLDEGRWGRIPLRLPLAPVGIPFSRAGHA